MGASEYKAQDIGEYCLALLSPLRQHRTIVLCGKKFPQQVTIMNI